MSRLRVLCLALFVVCVAGCAKPPAPEPAVVWDKAPVFDDAFWKQWGDGQAELSGYDLTTPRYGALRHGTAVSIVVTETFSNSDRVKADPGRHPKKDEFPVLKLNLMQDFSTGIYDYNLMTSAFLALTSVNLRPPGAPAKVSFSAQEWCGHAYAQLLFDSRYARYTAHSYFDGEADSAASLAIPNDALSEDALLLWARGFAAPVLAAGDSAVVPVSGALRQARLSHQRSEVAPAHVARSAASESITVPAGTFACDVLTVRVEGGRTWTFWVEAAAPRRVVRWTCSDGE
ncbi:MAG: hypothetical protein K8R56_04760, partial [Candidatus Eisenbacteria bacterium]|nr:hypothetical protein [Candidatus Eisenbacteria bacterium]